MKARIWVAMLSVLMLCAAERKYCAGILGQLRGRAAAQLRGNSDREFIFCLIGFIKWCHSKMVTPGAGHPPLATPLYCIFVLLRAPSRVVSCVPSNFMASRRVPKLSENNCAQSFKKTFMYSKFCTNPVLKYSKCHISTNL